MRKYLKPKAEILRIYSERILLFSTEGGIEKEPAEGEEELPSVFGGETQVDEPASELLPG